MRSTLASHWRSRKDGLEPESGITRARHRARLYAMLCAKRKAPCTQASALRRAAAKAQTEGFIPQQASLLL